MGNDIKYSPILLYDDDGKRINNQFRNQCTDISAEWLFICGFLQQFLEIYGRPRIASCFYKQSVRFDCERLKDTLMPPINTGSVVPGFVTFIAVHRRVDRLILGSPFE